MSVFTVTTDCVGCGACLATCPEAALRVVAGRRESSPLIVLAERCTGCAECAEVCPAEACLPVGGWS